MGILAKHKSDVLSLTKVAFFETTPDAVLVYEKRHVRECNGAALKMFGYADKARLMNATSAQLSPPKQPNGADSDSASQVVAEELARKGFHRFEWTFRRADGTDFPTTATMFASTVDGEEFRFCCVADLSEILATREAKAKAHLALIARFDRAAIGAIEAVSGETAQLNATAQALSANAEQNSRQAAAATTATQEAASNVQTVAAAAEELASSINEIGRQVEQSSRAAQMASDDAGRTGRIVKGLAESSARIGAVVKLINDVASQTNLLALNATIEAARAGDAGKGFAVVAGEVKSLANQTAKATDEIRGQIAAVQSASQQAVEAIDTIVGRIGEINQIAAAIASAVEEQTAATAEIARNVQRAAAGAQQVSTNIDGVTLAAKETGNAAVNVLSSVRQLTKQADDLKTLVHGFLDDIVVR
jgi:methyl-accepting chemotaxis protein